MKQAGIIEGSSFKLNLKNLGLDVTVFLGIHLKSTKGLPELIEKLKDMKEVVEAYYTTGNYALLVKIHTKNISDFHQFLAYKLQTMDAIQSTESFISLDKPIDRNVQFE